MRYYVKIYQTQGVAEVRDRQDAHRILGSYSSFRDGLDWLNGARRQTEALNRAVACNDFKAMH